MLLALLALTLGWAALMQHFGGNIYGIMGPFALAVSLVVASFSSEQLRAWFRPTPRTVLSGLAVGTLMTLLTYPAFSLSCALFPRLQADVAVLYRNAARAPLAEALPWVLVIIVAEELLWRGALLHALTHRVSEPLAMVLSVASYAAAQIGTGSWIVVLLALVCGTVWTLQRRWSRSLLSPLLAHLIWTPVVILLQPVV